MQEVYLIWGVGFTYDAAMAEVISVRGLNGTISRMEVTLIQWNSKS